MDNREEVNEFGKARQELIYKVRKAFDLETDRGTCLMACDLFDNHLEELLNDKLTGSSKLKKSLFNFTGPLGSLSSKVKMSYSLGLIHKKLFDDLEIIRGIRNEFSHSYESMNFETPHIFEKIKKLQCHSNDLVDVTSREIFTSSVIGVAVGVFGSQLLAKKFSSIEDPVFLKNPTNEDSNEY